MKKKAADGNKAVVGQKDKKNNAPMVAVFVFGAGVALALIIAGYWFTHQPAKKSPKTVTPEQTYLESSNYKQLGTDQKINIALSKVSQLTAVNAYAEAQNQLSQIKVEYPTAESNLDFLVAEFTISKAQNDTVAAKAAARKIQALKKDLPSQYQYLKASINTYANS